MDKQAQQIINKYKYSHITGHPICNPEGLEVDFGSYGDGFVVSSHKTNRIIYAGCSEELENIIKEETDFIRNTYENSKVVRVYHRPNQVGCSDSHWLVEIEFEGKVETFRLHRTINSNWYLGWNSPYEYNEAKQMEREHHGKRDISNEYRYVCKMNILQNYWKFRVGHQVEKSKNFVSEVVSDMSIAV